MDPFTEISLYSGDGGGLLASQHLFGWRTVCYVEIDRLCQSTLEARIADGHLHDAPIWDDVRTFDGRPWRGLVDYITAGFPCQPYSIAGLGLGEVDERNLWEDTIRILREVQPRCGILLENVPALFSFDYFRRILGDVAQVFPYIGGESISAFDVGAPHLRERLWIMAYTDHGRCTISEDEHESKNVRGGVSH